MLKKIFTKEDKNNLIKELKRLEDCALLWKGVDNILDTYFPHTIYEIACALDSVIWKNVEYWEDNK